MPDGGLVVVANNSNDAEGHVAKMLERVGDEAKTYGYHFQSEEFITVGCQVLLSHQQAGPLPS
ncbi:hypothetical protein D3C80_1793880 [compost metagenome]